MEALMKIINEEKWVEKTDKHITTVL